MPCSCMLSLPADPGCRSISVHFKQCRAACHRPFMAVIQPARSDSQTLHPRPVHTLAPWPPGFSCDCTAVPASPDQATNACGLVQQLRSGHGAGQTLGHMEWLTVMHRATLMM